MAGDRDVTTAGTNLAVVVDHPRADVLVGPVTRGAVDGDLALPVEVTFAPAVMFSP
jgi:hypothetical protein